MKKIIGLFVCLFMMNVAMSQNESGTAIFNGKSSVDSKKGVYKFQCKEDLFTDDHFTMTIGHYTDHFMVQSEKNNGLRNITVKLNEVNDQNKVILVRLLVSLKLNNVNYNNKTYSAEDFVDNIIL